MEREVNTEARRLADAIRNNLVKPVYDGLLRHVDTRCKEVQDSTDEATRSITERLDKIEALLQQVVAEQAAWREALSSIGWSDIVETEK
jgi:hypothetical protein